MNGGRRKPLAGADYPGFGDLELSKRGNIEVRSRNQQTSIPDVFAGGDSVTGPATVVEAIGSGKRAAFAIHTYLRGEQFRAKRPPRPRTVVRPVEMDYREKAFIQRQEIPLIDLDRRMHTFDQVELGLDETAAQQEARRCMRCDICERCGKCEEVCEERLGVSAIKFFHAGESSLILKDYVHGLPKCIGCGACVNICPTGALQIEDRGDERVILMTGTVINRMKLETCDGCGKHYVPTVFVRHVGKSVDVEKDVFGTRLCPECKRIAGAVGIAGAEPHFSRARQEA